MSEGVSIEFIAPNSGGCSIYSETLATAKNNPTPAVNYVLNLSGEKGCSLMVSRYKETHHATTNVNDLRCMIYGARKDFGAYVEIGEGIQHAL